MKDGVWAVVVTLLCTVKDQHLDPSIGAFWDHQPAAGGVLPSDKSVTFISAAQICCMCVEVKQLPLAWSGQGASSKQAV